MNTPAWVEECFDELDELLEESQQTIKAKDVETLDDLDDLLAESTAIQAAKKAAKTGKKLTQEQQELLEANNLAEEIALWKEVGAVAHFVETECACGAAHKRFSGWYVYSTHRKSQYQTKLVRTAGHQGLPTSQYTTVEHSAMCHECLSTVGLAAKRVEELPILSSLGQGVEPSRMREQLVTALHIAQTNDLLAELTATPEVSS